MADTDLKQLTDANQARASDPRVSAWVSANAGTGKTTVLVNRVLRLLLHRDESRDAYTRPETILCLTYTKAAAGEMENRLFRTLSKWAVMPEPGLAGALKDLRGMPATEADMTRARQLFALTLDTKGGLKIHTIHAFCERLLHRFPIEAGVQADFDVLEDAERANLRNAAIDAVLERAMQRVGKPIEDALDKVIAATGEDRFRDIVGVALDKQEELRAIHRLVTSLETLGAEEAAALGRLLGAAETRGEDALLEEMAAVLDDAEIGTIVTALRTGGKQDQGVADALEQVLGQDLIDHRVAALRAIFLVSEGKKTRSEKTLATKAIWENHPDAANMLLCAHETFCALAREYAALCIAASTGALLTLADAIIGEYERLKAARAALDYDDLIFRTVRLLTTAGAAPWVLYKLDWGLDHILVDEAQDTSPAQWRVIGALAEEFFAGEGVREADRTVFAVGDEKQSIYSFQGAAPHLLREYGQAFERRVNAAGLHFEPVRLTVSFRSTAPVLEAVDRVFALDGTRDGVAWGEALMHHPVRAGQAGLVELWEMEEQDAHEPTHPMRPQDEAGGGAHARDKMVERIARTIRHWLDTGEKLEARGRKITPGDILILVRSRDEFVPKMIRALKARDVPVAGADRMRLTEQLGVMDLMAAGDFVLLPEDDLTLATLLKSPLVGLGDEDLFSIGYERRGSLWDALRDAAKDNSHYADAVDRLGNWLARADAVPPFEFFAGLLEEKGMRLRLALISRLGADAGDAIDEFLQLALDYERLAHPSLQGFLDWMRGAQAEVKRDMEQGRDEVRIMTAHGAKGLEANVVILPDTCKPPAGGGGNRAKLYSLPRASAPPDAPGHLVWAPSGTLMLPAMDDANEILKDAERRENNRLLYVAMTRARDRLYLAGYKGQKSPAEKCWYNLLTAGLDSWLTPGTDALGNPVKRFESAQTAEPEDKEGESEAAHAPQELPGWAQRDAAEEAPASLPLTPSAIPAHGDEDTAQLSEQDVVPPLARAERSRFLRGAIIHALLQYLPDIPSESREEKARAYVAARGGDLDDIRREEIVAETLAILRRDDFAPLFAPGSLAEVPIISRLGGAGGTVELNGQVDRLVVTDDEVLIVDYKTNRPPPQTPQDVAPLYRRQLAAYRAALSQVYPGKRVRTALLWTDGPTLMAISDELLDAAASILGTA